MSDRQATQQLQQLLVQHGVWESRAEERTRQVIQNLGLSVVRNVVQTSRNKWADLKSAANQLKPPFRLILPDELDAQVSARANQRKAFGKKRNKAPKGGGKGHDQPEMHIQASDLHVPTGVFQQEDGQSLGPVNHTELGPQARGVLILDQSDADAVLRLPRPVSQQGLCLIVLATPRNHDLHEVQPTRFPAMCRSTQEPLLVAGFVYQLGRQQVLRTVPKTKVAVEQPSAEAIRCLAYKDQLGSAWDSIVKQPVKTIFQLDQALLSHDAMEPSPVIDVWDRQWLTKRFEKCKADHADIFAFSMRILTDSADKAVQSSGTQGLYYEPRSQCGRYPNAAFHVTWLPQANFQDAKYAQQTSPQTTSLVRHGERYGLRCDAMNAQEIHNKHRPGTPLLMGGDKRTYILGPLPFTTSKEGVAKLLKEWDWDAKPLQPKGRSRDSTGIDWAIQGVEDPAFWIYPLEHGDVLITRAQPDKAETKAPSVSIVASRKTIEHLQRPSSDPWLEHDPWQQASGHKPATSASASNTVHMSKLEATIDRKIADALQQTNKSDDAPMEDTQMTGRVSMLEQQMKQLQQTQQGFDHRLGQMHRQLELQSKSFADAVDSKFADQMERIEALMAKRSRAE